MNKKIIILGIVFLLLISFAFAETGTVEWNVRTNYSSNFNTACSSIDNGFFTNEATGNLPSNFWGHCFPSIVKFDNEFNLVSSFVETSFGSALTGLMSNASEVEPVHYWMARGESLGRNSFIMFNSSTKLWEMNISLSDNPCSQIFTNQTNRNITHFFCADINGDGGTNSRFLHYNGSGDVLTNISIPSGDCTGVEAGWTNDSNKKLEDIWFTCSTGSSNVGKIAHFRFNETNLTLIDTIDMPSLTGITGNNLLAVLTSNVKNKAPIDFWVGYSGIDGTDTQMYYITKRLAMLNITIRDERSNGLIDGETFTVFVERTGYSESSSKTDNPYLINLTGDRTYDLEISSTNYAKREYKNIYLGNVSKEITVYLINSTLGTEVTFYIVDEALNPLENVEVAFTKIISGTRTVVAEETSDFAGQVILDLDSSAEYTINFSKTDYENREISLEPKDTDYLIELISTIGAYNVSVYEGITYEFSPSNIILNNNTPYNFTFTLNSSIWDLTNCTLKLKNGTTLLDQTSSYTSTGCYLRIEYNTASMTNITSEAIYELNSLYNFTVSHQYRVIYTYEGEFSLKNFLDDVSDFGMAGFDDFGRMMLALIVIFIITTLAAKNIGFTNPETLIFLVVAQVWFFSYVNWLYLDFVPDIGNSRKYFIAILITIAGGAFVIEKFVTK